MIGPDGIGIATDAGGPIEENFVLTSCGVTAAVNLARAEGTADQREKDARIVERFQCENCDGGIIEQIAAAIRSQK